MPFFWVQTISILWGLDDKSSLKINLSRTIYCTIIGAGALVMIDVNSHTTHIFLNTGPVKKGEAGSIEG